MNKKLPLIFLTLILSCCNNLLAQQKDSSGIFVANLEFDMESVVAIQCEGFASSMPKIMRHRHIDNKDSLKMLDSFLEKVKYQKKSNEIDVRGQVYYSKPGYTAVTICLNDNAIMIDGKLVKRNDKFLAFLRSMTL